MSKFYSTKDWNREIEEDHTKSYRSDARVDYSRLIHSASFRRLVGKTQLLPYGESDFFRNRLTHSLEVAQIAKSIAQKINSELSNLSEADKNRLSISQEEAKSYQLDTDLIEFSALAHDLGHPPFGHIGEAALDALMINNGGFEGNAQTLRIISKLEKKYFQKDYEIGFTSSGDDVRVGLNSTYRTLASTLKYDNMIPISNRESVKNPSGEIISPMKGYYNEEKELVDRIKKHTLQLKESKDLKYKTIECQIMDIADDIAYSTYDLEDLFKAGFLTPLKIISAIKNTQLLDAVAKKVQDSLKIKYDRNQVEEILINTFASILEVSKVEGYEDDTNEEMKYEQEIIHARSIAYIHEVSKDVAMNGYRRTQFTSELVGDLVNSVRLTELNTEEPILSKVEMEEEINKVANVLKYFVFESQIMSPKFKIAEFRGKEIVKEIFESLMEKDNYRLMPIDFVQIFKASTSKHHQMRTTCDFIAGMTDRYALEFYGRLKSENPESIFKPL